MPENTAMWVHVIVDKVYIYGVATISRLLKIIGLFCKRALQKRLYSAKETCNFKVPTNRSHPISIFDKVSMTHMSYEINESCPKKGDKVHIYPIYFQIQPCEFMWLLTKYIYIYFWQGMYDTYVIWDKWVMSKTWWQGTYISHLLVNTAMWVHVIVDKIYIYLFLTRYLWHICHKT